MTSEKALTILKNTEKPYIISGFKVKEPNGIELNCITQHYTIGEYVAIYIESRCIYQKSYANQNTMNTALRKNIKKALQRNAVILHINTRQIVKDEQ